MRLSPQQSLATITALTVFSFTSLSQQVQAAEHHVVNLAELQDTMNSSRSVRAKNLKDLDRVLSLPQAQEALQKSHVNMNQVRGAIAQLDDQELDRLAQKARTAEQDVQGGLIVGLLALIGLIVVIIVVVSVVS